MTRAGDGRRPSSDFTELLLRGFGGEAWFHQHGSFGIGPGDLWCRKGYNEAGTAALGIEQLDLPAVGGRDRPHDREAQAAAAARRRVASSAGEALEYALAHLVRHAGTAVGHLEDRRAALAAHGHRHGSAGRGVEQRVLDQVA